VYNFQILTTQIAWQGHAGAALDAANGFTVVDCDACRFKHIVPIPTPAELERVYGHEYYAVEKPLYIQRHVEDREWLDLVYAERYDAFERLLNADRRRLVDVGSGPGFFLKHGADRGGWSVRGLEPASQAVAHSRGLGLEITQGFLDASTAPALGRFDVVHMNEVLEHVPDPRGLLALVDGLLDPGGLVALMVPNDYSPFQAALRDACGISPWWVAPPHHVNYFDVDSIQRLLAERFEAVSVETSFPIDMFLLMGDMYIGDDALGRACHAKRKTFELALARAGKSALKQDMYRRLAQLGIGRDVFVIARKPA
jgi:2-polyprenyl-3-methyl-5-hydroxy-6-metoxy-1,4-benzoquinol methylase